MTTERSFPTRLGDWARAHPRLLGASVIVAALVLTGTALVIATTLFSSVPIAGDVDPTPSPSASAEPSAASDDPSASAAPSQSSEPTPLGGAEWPPVGDPSTEFLLPPMWTVSVVNDLNVRSGPGTEHPAIGQMDEGDIAKVVDVVDGEWVWVAADGAIGYVNAGPQGDRYLVPTKTPWEVSFTRLSGVASDGEAYLAYGVQYAFDYPPYELHYTPGFALRSTDGVSWTPLEPGFETAIGSVAVGEEGWVALVSTPLSGENRVSFSPDGESWDEPVTVGSGLNVVAHGPVGFVGVNNDGAWISADGRSWEGPRAMVASQEIQELESSDAGYVGFNRHTDALWASVNGDSWVEVEHGGARVSDAELVGSNLHVVLVDDQGATTVRRGTLSDGGVEWSDAQAIDAAGLHVDRITQGPDGLLAVGWDETDLVPVLWTSDDGAAWDRVADGPDALDSVSAFEPEWGPAGWVGPELKRSTDGEAWLASEHSLAYDGPVPPCPPAEKISTIVLSYLGRYAESCLGEASVTIRGVVAQGGFGGCCPPAPEPAWLASRVPPAIIASGEQGEPQGIYHLALYPPPDVDASILHEPGTWLEIVGHYRDPASATCRHRPLPDFPNPLGSHEEWEAECRQRFVVESVIEVDGP